METRSFRLGLFGARMDATGLGHQSLGYFEHLKPHKTLVVDISALEKSPDRVMKQHPEWYPGATFIYGFPNEGDIREFLKDLDVVLIAESAYNYDFYRIARELGVKTAVAYNWEFFDWTPGSLWANNPPDMFIAPSSWHYEDVQDLCNNFFKARGQDVKHVYLHVPVNRDKIPFRNVETATNFIHIAGRPAAHDRNGTYTFLNAIQTSDGMLRGTVYTQDKNLESEIHSEFPSVSVKTNTVDYADIYKKGSVLVLPRKYGGNCLPMNEALSAGMPVIMSRVSPQKDFLPSRWLVDAQDSGIEFAPRFPIKVYEVEPAALAMKMLWFKSLSNQDMREQGQLANQLADEISWNNMAPKYKEVLEALCRL